jgi:hypothetical protein
MDMQDKEFDGLFRSKLDEFETEPSTKVWADIAVELDASKRKKAPWPFLSIAASIIVLIAGGILFVPTKKGTNTKQRVKARIAKTIQPATVTGSTTTHGPLVLLSANKPVKLKETYIQARAKKAFARAGISGKDTNAVSIKVEVAKTDDHELIAPVSPKQPVISKAVVPGIETQLAVKVATGQPGAVSAKPPLLANQLPDNSNKELAPAKSRRKIRSLGDLINLVVAKVDKRKDKVLEFSDDDDNESNLVSVNLGIIKIKKGE